MPKRYKIGTAWRQKFLQDLRRDLLQQYQAHPTPAGEIGIQIVGEIETLLTHIDRKGYSWSILAKMVDDLPHNTGKRTEKQAKPIPSLQLFDEPGATSSNNY